MDQMAIILAALAAAGENSTFTPVQVQKLFFLLDKEASHLFNGPHFSFKPYDYGPFDRKVYDMFDTLSALGKAEVKDSGKYRIYSLNQQGFQDGYQILKELSPKSKEYLVDIVKWVKSLSFEQLVSSVYQRYPEMKVNSVFRG